MVKRCLARPGQEREMRECRSCYSSGQVVEDVELASGEWEVQPMSCFIGQGSGKVCVYLYPKPKPT